MLIYTKFKNGSIVKMLVKRDAIIEVVPGIVINTRFRLTPSGVYTILYDLSIRNEYRGNEKNSTLIEVQSGVNYLGVSEEILMSYHNLREGIITTMNKPRDHVEDWLFANPSAQIKSFPLESIYEFEVKTEFWLNDCVTTGSVSWKRCVIVAVEVQFLNSKEPFVVYGLKSKSSNYQCFDVSETLLLKYNQPMPIREYEQSLVDYGFLNTGKYKINVRKVRKVPKGQLQFIF